MNAVVGKTSAVAGLIAAAVVLAACQRATGINKAGTVDRPVKVIEMQMPDDDEGYGQVFAQAVAQHSHGALKVTLRYQYSSAVPANEARLLAALRSGKVQFSFQPARDFAAARLPGFEALDAPFAVTTVQASDALAASPVAGVLLHELSSLGLVGLGLIPAEPRQILSTRPLIAPSAFRGVRIRITDNPETERLIRAIGADPVQGVSAGQAKVMLGSRSLAGIEISPYYAIQNSYDAEAPYLSSYAVIPKFETLAATRRAWLGLTSRQHTWIRQAIADTLAYARQDLPGLASEDLAELCGHGLVVDKPSASALAKLVQEAGGPPAGTQVSTIERMIRADVPGSGPSLDAIPVPVQCPVAQTVADAIALHGLSVPPRSGTRGATIPPGTYVTTDSAADLHGNGLHGSDWDKPITYITRIYADGNVVETQQPEYPGEPCSGHACHGYYVVKGDVVTFVWNHQSGLTPEKVRWSYYGGLLTFSVISVQDQAGEVMYADHPWRKVG